MQRSSDDRIFAVLSHLSCLIPGYGMPLPTLAWFEGRKNGSAQGRFQALQALGYQTLGYTLVALFAALVAVLLLVLLLVLGVAVGESGGEIFELIFLLTFFSMMVVIGLSLLAYFIFPVIGAVMTGLGKDFRYPLLGSRLARFLQYDPASPDASLDPAAEERWVASMGHFAVIYPIWGMLAPLYLFFVADKKAYFLRFQSLQAALFQGAASGLSVLMGGFYMVFSLALLPMIPGLETATDQQVPFLVGIFLMLLCTFIFLLFIPLFHIVGQLNGLRILWGREPRYKLVAWLADRWVRPEADESA